MLTKYFSIFLRSSSVNAFWIIMTSAMSPWKFWPTAPPIKKWSKSPVGPLFVSINTPSTYVAKFTPSTLVETKRHVFKLVTLGTFALMSFQFPLPVNVAILLFDVPINIRPSPVEPWTTLW